jgi:hypothetical protein
MSEWAIGAMFVGLGVVLAGFGLITSGEAARYAASGGANINLWRGTVMAVFGVIFLLATRTRSAGLTGSERD